MNQHRLGRIVALMLLMAGLAVMPVAAQDASPVAEDGRTMPVSIRQGPCTELGEVVHDLTEIDFPNNAEVVGEPALPAYQSVTQLEDTSIDDLVSGEYVVTVARSLEDPNDIVTCGLIGGTRFDNSLLFSLAPVQEPEFAGAVLLGEYDSSTQVVVYLITTPDPLADTEGPIESPIAADGAAGMAESPEPQAQTTLTPATAPGATPEDAAGMTTGTMGGMMASAAASPIASPVVGGGQGGQVAQTEVTVEMVDIDFNPNEFTIPANTDVTIVLPNNGAAVHSFVVSEHNNENLPFEPIRVEVQPGQSQTVTVNAPPGEYYFFCDIPGHEAAGMFGTMTVVEQ